VKRLGLIRTICLALLIGFGLLFVTADRRARAAVEFQRPTTLLTFVRDRLHALVGARIDHGTAGFRETVQQHESPKKSLER